MSEKNWKCKFVFAFGLYYKDKELRKMDRNEIILESQKLDYKIVNGINRLE